MRYSTVTDFDFRDKVVLVRADLNVPLDNVGQITNDKRIKASLPTIKLILEKGAKQIILMSHLGRPKGINKDLLKMNHVADLLTEYLGEDVHKEDDCIDITLPPPDIAKIILLENLRFHKEERENNSGFAKQLASLGDLYVNDAFATLHRSHASVVGVTEYLPSAAGLLLEKEIKVLTNLLKDPKKPFIVILGGAKVSDKIPLIRSLLPLCDKILIGGAMIYTFYRAIGLEVGISKIENDMVPEAEKLLQEAGDKIILPHDNIVANQFHNDADKKMVLREDIEPMWMGMDIGELSIDKFKKIISEGATIFWNGPMGVFEMDSFANGTRAIAECLSKSDATTIIGGGDSAAAVELLGLSDNMTHISTGGGAALELLEGVSLPGISALEKNYSKFKRVDKASLGDYISPLHDSIRN